MSKLYSNIRYLCSANNIKMVDIESPMQPGTISRYEKRGKIEDLPISIVCKAAKTFCVSVEDLINRDFAREKEAETIKEEIKRLQERLVEIMEEK
mgnify:CR=1 FL=1